MAGLTCEALPDAGLHPAPPPRRCALAVSAAAPEVLREILQPEVNLVIWSRSLPAGLRTGLIPMLLAAPFSAVVEDAPDPAVAALGAKLPVAAPSDLLRDITDLAKSFAAIAGTGAVRIRLEAITGRACYRWHADAVGLRLLCTYRGPGTQWLPLAGGALAARALDPRALPCSRERIATGAVAILKGEGFPGNAGNGCIHRSPPAGAGARARLLLCIDEPGRIPLA